MNPFGWLNDQLLRMQWLSDLVAWLVRDGFGLDPAGRLGGSVQFFVYDVIKIFILLGVLIFTVSWVQSYFPPERTRRILGQRKGLGANIMAAPQTASPAAVPRIDSSPRRAEPSARREPMKAG